MDSLNHNVADLCDDVSKVQLNGSVQSKPSETPAGCSGTTLSADCATATEKNGNAAQSLASSKLKPELAKEKKDFGSMNKLLSKEVQLNQEPGRCGSETKSCAVGPIELEAAALAESNEAPANINKVEQSQAICSTPKAKSIMKKKEVKHSTPSQSKQNKTNTSKSSTPFSFNQLDSPFNASFLGNSRFIATPIMANSTPIGEDGTPKTKKVNFVRRKRLDLISETKRQKIAEVIRSAMYRIDIICKDWQRTRVEGARSLQGFVTERIDSSGLITKDFTFQAAAHLTSFSETLKFMTSMSQNFKEYVRTVSNMDLEDEQFEMIKPFCSMSINKIIIHMRHLCDSYQKEYEFKYRSCRELADACGYDQPVMPSVDYLNSIVATWGTDVHIKRKDPHLLALLQEIKL